LWVTLKHLLKHRAAVVPKPSASGVDNAQPMTPMRGIALLSTLQSADIVLPAPRLVNLLAVFCILSWRVFWLTMTNRIDPDADPGLVFTDLELRILDLLVADKHTAHLRQHLLSHYLTKLAQLGGYLARNGDSPPGNETIWRGLTRLVDIQLGVIMGAEIMGNREV
jgi:hypothetical protein